MKEVWYKVVAGTEVLANYFADPAAALAVRDRLEADGYACGRVVRTTPKSRARVRPKR